MGWALGDGKENYNDPTWDAVEADALYTLLERDVIPEFCCRDRKGIPVTWATRIRESMACLTTPYSSNRAVRQFAELYSLPVAAIYRERAADNGKIGEQIVACRHTLGRAWSNLRFGETTITNEGGQHKFETQVSLNGFEPNAVRVELYAEGINGGDPVRKEMTRGPKLVGAENGYVYGAQVPATQPAMDYTARVFPHRKEVAVPLEDSQILWQR